MNHVKRQARLTPSDMNSNIFFIQLMSVLISVVEVVILFIIRMLEYVFEIK